MGNEQDNEVPDSLVGEKGKADNKQMKRWRQTSTDSATDSGRGRQEECGRSHTSQRTVRTFEDVDDMSQTNHRLWDEHSWKNKSKGKILR